MIIRYRRNNLSAPALLAGHSKDPTPAYPRPNYLLFTAGTRMIATLSQPSIHTASLLATETELFDRQTIIGCDWPSQQVEETARQIVLGLT